MESINKINNTGRILITGASGFLGRHLVKALLQKTECQVIAILGRSENKTDILPKYDRLTVFPCASLFQERFKDIDTVVNCAFARSNDYGVLSESLKFTSDLINKLRENNVKSVINISSQGVYKRVDPRKLADENSEIAPMDIYAFAKYASEQLFLSSNLPHITNVRMASINMPQRFLNDFVQKVKKGETITITTPKLPASLIDVRDAAEALVAIVNLDHNKRAATYNVGIGYQKTILDYAMEVNEVGRQLGYNPKIRIEDNHKLHGAGMDPSLVMNDCRWAPKITSIDMIKEMFKM